MGRFSLVLTVFPRWPNPQVNGGERSMRRKISIDTILTGIFVVMLFLLFSYGTLKELHPALDRLFMVFGQAVGLVFLVLTVFCIIGLAFLIIRRLYGFGCGGK